MTASWKRFLIAFATPLALAFGLASARCDEPENLPQAPSAEEKSDEPQLEVDEGDDSAEEVQKALEEAVAEELNSSTKESSAEDLLNMAMELKLTSQSLLDLTKVVSLCNKAEAMGLDDDNRDLAEKLRVSARLERGLAVSQLFMNPELVIYQLPRGWEALRNNAISDLKVALAENNDMPIANLSLGRLYMLAERPNDAKSALDLAIANEDAETPVRVLALMFRASLEKDASAAIPYLERAIELEPEGEPRLYALYSANLQELGRTDEALKQIERAVELDPVVPDYKIEKAKLLAQAKRYDEARALFDEATKDSDDNLLLQVQKGQFLATINDYDAAIALFTKLLEKYDAPILYLLRGSVYIQKRDFEKSLADANQALRRDANLLGAIRLKGSCFVETKRYDEAVRAFQQLRAKSNNEEGKQEASTLIAYALSKQGKYKRATEILKKELEKRPDNADVLRSLADIELQFGHWGEARDLYKKLVELEPKNSGVLNNYSWLLATCPDEQYRDAALALEYGKRAAEETLYVVPHILSTLAAAYAENGDFESARSWAQKAVELGEKENHESLESLKKELESYKNDQPWRETPETTEEVDETENAAEDNNDGDANATSEEKAEEAPVDDAQPASNER